MAATDITGQLARFMVQARKTGLPPEIAQAGKHRILDTFGRHGLRRSPGSRKDGYQVRTASGRRA